jgi:hypothetical protein
LAGGTDVLKHIAEFFPHLPEGNKNEVVAVLRQVACIPIEPRQGMLAPPLYPYIRSIIHAIYVVVRCC